MLMFWRSLKVACLSPEAIFILSPMSWTKLRLECPHAPMVFLTAAGTTMHLSDVLATYYDSLDSKKSRFLLTWSCTPAWRWNTLWGAGTRGFPSVGIVFQGIQASTPKGRWHTLCWSSLCRRSRPKRGIWWSGVDPPPRKASSGRKTDRGCHRRLEKKWQKHG